MAYNSTNLALRIWNQLSDVFSHTELEENWLAVDTHDHTGAPKGKQIPSGGLVAGSVHTVDLGDGAVTNPKLGDSSVSTNKLQDGSITPGKLSGEISSSIVPTGVLTSFAGAGPTPPGGWVFCDGATYDGTNPLYEDLWGVVGTTYGGTGVGAFKVPNLSGRVPVGVGTAVGAVGATAHTLGQSTGEEKHSLLATESGLPAHGHTLSGGVSGAGAINTGTQSQNHNHGYNDRWGAVNRGSAVENGSNSAEAVAWQNHIHGAVFTATGNNNVSHTHQLPAHGHAHTFAVTANAGATASTTHNNMQPYLTVNYIIKL